MVVWADTPLIFIYGSLTVQYRDTALEPIVVPFVQRHNVTFQHDNARPHVARICQANLANSNVNVLPRPAFSPDLSPIEHLCDVLDRRVGKRQSQPTSHDELGQALTVEWENIAIRQVNGLVDQLQAPTEKSCKENRGHSRY